MTLTEAKRITGGISFPSKLAGTAAASSLHPGACITGRKLSEASDKNVCFKCFGKKGRFSFPSVQHSLWHKTEIVKRLNVNKHPLDYDRWIQAWVTLIRHYSMDYFRHFMVGDVQSQNHHYALRAICTDTSSTQHWIPSLDWYRFATPFDPPIKNAVIRYTAPKVNQKNQPRRPHGPKAIVVTNEDFVPSGYFKCPATFTARHTCKAHACTMCWTDANIAYKEH